MKVDGDYKQDFTNTGIDLESMNQKEEDKEPVETNQMQVSDVEDEDEGYV